MTFLISGKKILVFKFVSLYLSWSEHIVSVRSVLFPTNVAAWSEIFDLQGEELKQKGFGGIYGVGKAAEHKPALVVLSHLPAGATQTVAWVGKGIVYDTGGLSIKVR